MIDPKTIRSAQFLDTYYPIVDGVVQVVNNYAKLMNETGYSCVVCPKPLKKSFDDSVFSYDVFRTNSIKLPIAEYSLPAPKLDTRLKKFLDSKDLDLVHVHSPFMEGTFAASYAKKHGIPCVATFHSKYYDDTLNITGSKAVAKAVTAKIVHFYKKADSVWTVSEGAATVLRSYGYRGDILIMKNGTTYTMPPNPEELKLRAARRFSIPTDKRTLLFVGHQIWHKNLKLILDAFRLLCNRSDEYRLLIVGDGYDAEEILDYADKQNYPEGFVRFLGRINDRELLSGLYLLSDLFFFPSVYDTSGLVIHEAASLGLPSLLTAGSNAAEAIVKDVSGFTAEENKVAMFREILRVFNTKGLLEKVGEGARRDIARTWEQIIPDVQDEYAEIIEKYKSTHRR